MKRNCFVNIIKMQNNLTELSSNASLQKTSGRAILHSDGSQGRGATRGSHGPF